MMTPRLAVKDTIAARMLDLPADDFRKLVRSGSLPPPVNIGKHERWRVADLDAVLTGAKIESDEFEP